MFYESFMLDALTSPLRYAGNYPTFQDIPTLRIGDVITIEGREYILSGIDLGRSDNGYMQTIHIKPKHKNDTFVLAEKYQFEPLA